jgi:hypothetical protein
LVRSKKIRKNNRSGDWYYQKSRIKTNNEERGETCRTNNWREERIKKIRETSYK